MKKKIEMAKSNVEMAHKELEQARKERADVLWREIQPRVEEWGRVGVPIVMEILEDDEGYETEETNLQLLHGFIMTWMHNLPPRVSKNNILKQLSNHLEDDYY